MDMNFPHQNREQNVGDQGPTGPIDYADQKALLTRAIARQASSPSAKDFGKASRGLSAAKTALHSSFMEERMAFFAGRYGSELSGRREPLLFKTGCFRPDLAQQEIREMHE